MREDNIDVTIGQDTHTFMLSGGPITGEWLHILLMNSNSNLSRALSNVTNLQYAEALERIISQATIRAPLHSGTINVSYLSADNNITNPLRFSSTGISITLHPHYSPLGLDMALARAFHDILHPYNTLVTITGDVDGTRSVNIATPSSTNPLLLLQHHILNTEEPSFRNALSRAWDEEHDH